MALNCPKCQTELVRRYYKGILEVDSCPACRGMWLDFEELDHLEDLSFDQDDFKGSLVHYPDKTSCCCPHCGGPLTEFQYRLYSLKLDACLTEKHGFWLDYGEDVRVLELMDRHKDHYERKISAEAEWMQFLEKIKTGSFLNNFRDFFK
ncbi:MAG: zf-TFIIB domain-containing protein [Anaerolineales bacterium]|nr:zf-TFIIB domain-containing protein [Anaerolineales bacterium]